MAALGQHQGDQAATCANVEDPVGVGDRSPGAQQYAVRAHLHGAAVVLDVKLLEGKTTISSHLTPHHMPATQKMVGDYSD